MFQYFNYKNYCKDTGPLYQSFMYSVVSLLSGIYPLPAMHSHEQHAHYWLKTMVISSSDKLLLFKIPLISASLLIKPPLMFHWQHVNPCFTCLLVFCFSVLYHYNLIIG